MFYNKHNGQGVLWVILTFAIVAIISLWIAKKPSMKSFPMSPEPSESAQANNPITPTTSLQEIDNALQELNAQSTEIDRGINDKQLDISM